VVDVRGDDRAAASDLVADEFGRDEVGDGGAEVLTVAGGGKRLLAPQVLADRHIFHFWSDDAAARIMHLGHIRAGARAQNAFADLREGLDAA
jgi:hypothetical protein